jgi:hypothetical protein
MLLVVFSIWSLPAANAYVDPGTGSFVLQAALGAFLAAALAVKVFWRRIVGFVTGRRGDEASEDANRSAPASDD